MYDINPIKKVEGPVKSGPTATNDIILDSDRNVKENISDSEYLELAKNPKANETKLRELVEERFYVAFYLIKLYNKKCKFCIMGEKFEENTMFYS